MKKIIAIFSAIIVLISSALSVSASALLKDRSDFEWGIGGHNSGYAAYPERTYKDQVKLAAQMGLDVYRFNYNPTNISMLNYLDKMVAEVQAYGMDFMLVMDDTSGTPQDVANRAKIVAGRYKKGSAYGFIKYIQIFGEADVAALEQSGTTYKYDGSKAEHYSPQVIDEYYAKFDAAIKTIRSVNTDAKIVISFSYVHYGFLLALQAKGLKWDIIGPDWYEDMGTFKKLLDPLEAAFPDYKFLICESNVMSTTDTTNASLSRWKWLLDSMDYCYNDNRIIGFLFYELFDELTIANDPKIEQREKYFGFVSCSEDGTIGKPKAIFYEVQRLLGGNPNIQPIYKSTSSSPVSGSPSSSSKAPSKVNSTVISSQVISNSGSSSAAVSDTVTSSLNSETISSSTKSMASSSGKTDNRQKSNNVWILVVVIVVILIAGGTVLFIFFKKKRDM